MKIGILTFHNGTNYGGFLQCFAMYRFLKDIGHNVSVIDFSSTQRRSFLKQNFDRILSVSSISDITDIFYAFLKKRPPAKLTMTEEEQEQAALLFSQARKNSLHLTGAVTETTIGVIAKQFDAIIIGSDQVWADIHEKQAVYLGEWRPAFSGRLLAYAACSPLKKIQRPYLKRNRKLLAGFAGISVRDQHTADIFENAYNIRYPVVADPTLLFRKWDEVAEPVRRNEKYILFYIIRQELEGTLANAAARLKKLYPGCRILTVLTTETKLDRNAAYIDEFVIPNPFQWVSLIRHAACVLTDSYHCALFSLQFSVPFFSYYREKDYGKYRFLELRNRFHLSDPFITSSEMIQKAGSRFTDTSYLADFIDLSKKFLTDSLNK